MSSVLIFYMKLSLLWFSKIPRIVTIPEHQQGPKPDKPEPKNDPSAPRADLDDPPNHIRLNVTAISGCMVR
jgi:hypothetical protein